MEVPLAFSTDWPVVPVDVMANMQCAIAPLDLGPNWPDQSQTLINTLIAYTATNAWMDFKEVLSQTFSEPSKLGKLFCWLPL